MHPQYTKGCRDIILYISSMTWDQIYPLVSYLENPLLCIENNPLNIDYLLNTNICMMPFVTHITQFYTLQMTRCDNIFDLLYCNEKRKCLQLKSVSSPIEMRTLSETDFFSYVLLFEGWIYLSNWPPCRKPILFLNACFISPSLCK